MADDPLSPALTPDQWAAKCYQGAHTDVGGWHDSPELALTRGGLRVGPEEEAPRIDVPAADFHALAALCLHAQPFGFTQADVDLLRHVVRAGQLAMWRTNDRGDMVPFAYAVSRLADRIAALLPPADA